jgi:hypothetical protein
MSKAIHKLLISRYPWELHHLFRYSWNPESYRLVSSSWAEVEDTGQSVQLAVFWIIWEFLPMNTKDFWKDTSLPLHYVIQAWEKWLPLLQYKKPMSPSQEGFWAAQIVSASKKSRESQQSGWLFHSHASFSKACCCLPRALDVLLCLGKGDQWILTCILQGSHCSLDGPTQLDHWSLPCRAPRKPSPNTWRKQII